MKRVLVTYAGGRIGIGFSRALKAAPEPVRLIGADASKYQLHRAVADEKWLIPRAGEEDYISVLSQIIERTEADFVWPSHEKEIHVISKHAGALGARVFLPSPEVIELCQDKMASYRRLQEAGIRVPHSMFIETETHLSRAFADLGPNIWIRAVSGTGGKGSLPVSDFETAKKWIDIHKGWGNFMAAQRLTERTVTWESLWDHGKLVLAQGRRRLYWEFSSMTFSGVTGVAGALQWAKDPVVDQVAVQAVKAVSPTSHGAFSVDMTYDEEGMPNVTEINVGRFMSGGVLCAYSLGVNVPHLVLKLALGEDVGVKEPILNPYPENVVLIHGIDVEPVMITTEEIEQHVEVLENMRRSRAVL